MYIRHQSLLYRRLSAKREKKVFRRRFFTLVQYNSRWRDRQTDRSLLWQQHFYYSLFICNGSSGFADARTETPKKAGRDGLGWPLECASRKWKEREMEACYLKGKNGGEEKEDSSSCRQVPTYAYLDKISCSLHVVRGPALGRGGGLEATHAMHNDVLLCTEAKLGPTRVWWRSRLGMRARMSGRTTSARPARFFLDVQLKSLEVREHLWGGGGGGGV